MYGVDVDEIRRTLEDVMASMLGKPPSHECRAHNRAGEHCGKGPVPGGEVCRNHGGATPAVVGKAELRLAERSAIMEARRNVLELTDAELIDQFGNPGETLQWIIALSRALASRLHVAVADLPDLVYHDAFGNIHVRGEVSALIKSLALAGSHAEKALRLGLDRRGLDLQEQHIRLLDRALDTAMAQAGLAPDAQRTVRRVLKDEILAADESAAE
jgi:hypothetical protein